MRTTVLFSLIFVLLGCAPDSIDLPGDMDIPDEVEEEPVFPVDFQFTNTLNDTLALTSAVALIDNNDPQPLFVKFIFTTGTGEVVIVEFQNLAKDKEFWNQEIFEFKAEDTGKPRFILDAGESPRLEYSIMEGDTATAWIDGDFLSPALIISAMVSSRDGRERIIELNYEGEYTIEDARESTGG